MTKAKSTVKTVSISDIALTHGRAENAIMACAVMALESINGFPVLKDVSEENMTKLRDGYALAYKEIFKPVTYAVINGHYVQASQEHISNDKVEKIEMTLEYCMSFTANEIGTMFKDEPEKKKLIRTVRDGLSTYVTKKITRLVTKANEILKARSGETTRREVVLFEQSVSKFFEAQIKSVKVKEKRGDASANPVKFLSAIEAFWKAYRA
jgi:hypothetical protein